MLVSLIYSLLYSSEHELHKHRSSYSLLYFLLHVPPEIAIVSQQGPKKQFEWKNRISNSKYMLFPLLWQLVLYVYVWAHVHMGACVHGHMFAYVCGSQRTIFSVV